MRQAAGGMVREAERDGLLFALAVAAGSADGWSYFGLGHAFVANMTGNTVLVGLAVFQNRGDVLHPLLSLACYAAGVVIASLLTRKTGKPMVWSRAVSRTLLLEGGLIAASEAGWVMIKSGWGVGTPGRDLLTLNGLLGLVALAVGMQSGAMLQLKIPGIVTTYITGTWTTLMNGVTRFAIERQRQPPAQKVEFAQRLLMQAGVLAAYFLSAVLTGWLFRYLPAGVGVLPAGMVLLAAVYGMVRG